ncbi:3-dehydroquinate dehydratase [Sulfurimonas aquatica]|uniref:3-dehydroquinate dehydratase n=1 Tax=Sulfurimonas aquatica TaxID=2672570 RepID=A0A975GDW9_9BACT|nr:3-dehydroquinate dehydratase [Sulfurimonas aquatica]QSZ42803.1 3-dehydroquinate dehydratase [Sulfurimonas aquatica]
MKYSRGLAALILTLFFQTQLFAEYLYKDEVIFNPKFNEEIESLGSELYKKTGISLRLVMLKELPNGLNVVDYEKELLKEFNEPTILLTFSEMDSRVDIAVNDMSLYNYFNKKQVLSPSASLVQAYFMAIFYTKSWDDFNEMRSDYGGSILPLLASKAKKGELLGKYSGSMFNGYLDIAEQVAVSKGTRLDSFSSKNSDYVILAVKFFFYSFIVYGVFMYIKRKIYMRRKRKENE